jgi:hypothetical protein
MNNVFKNVTITQKMLLIVLGLMCTNQLNGNFFNKHWCDQYTWTGWRGGLYKPRFKYLKLTREECKRHFDSYGIPTAQNITYRPQMNVNTANRLPIVEPMPMQHHQMQPTVTTHFGPVQKSFYDYMMATR